VNELVVSHTTGANLYAVILNSVGQALVGTAPETPVSANWQSYSVSMIESSTTGLYRGNMPAVAAGTYGVTAYRRTGGAPATTDAVIATGEISWTGSAVASVSDGVNLAATGLDAIPITDPGGMAGHTTLPRLLVALYRRFFCKMTLTSTQIKTYKDDATTVNTSQAVSDDGVTQVQGPAL
jgi:hypothetical protein